MHPGVVRAQRRTRALVGDRLLPSASSERVYVIWYEAPADVDSAHPVHPAERRADPADRRRAGQGAGPARSRATERDRHEIAAQWDSIERDLRDPEVWAFVTGRADDGADAHQPAARHARRRTVGPARPLFHTFETLRQRIERTSPEASGTRSSTSTRSCSAGTTTATSSTRSATSSHRADASPSWSTLADGLHEARVRARVSTTRIRDGLESRRGRARAT